MSEMLWTNHLKNLLRPGHHSAVAIGENLYLFRCPNWLDCPRNVFIQQHLCVLNTRTFQWSIFPLVDSFQHRLNPSSNQKLVAYKNKVYIWTPMSEIYCFDTVKNVWTIHATTGYFPKIKSTVCSWSHYLYIFTISDVYALDLETMQWTYCEVIDPMPNMHHSRTSVVIGNHIYFMYQLQDLGKLWRFDFLTNHWDLIDGRGTPPPCRMNDSAFAYNSKIYVFGGFHMSQEQHCNDLHEFNPVQRLWRKISISGIKGPDCRAEADCIVINDRMFLLDGFGLVPRKNMVNSFTVSHIRDIYILDFKPSLQTLCKITIHKYKLDLSELPKVLRKEVEQVDLSFK